MPTKNFTSGSDNVLVVVDLSAQLFRAYHAIRPLSSPTGEPTHAVYGVVTILERLVKEMRPTRFAIALDSGRKTFRADLYPAYKANRPEPPEDLIVQFRRASEVVRAFTPHVWQKDGFEADDLIATAVRRARASGLSTLIVGADKDLMQLVGDDVRLWDCARDRVIGPEEVFEKFAVRVDQLGDLLALMGDSSDNIPGVKGIGPKTAAELLGSYGTLDGIYARLSEIPRKRIRDLLATHEASARLSRKLVTLADDCDPDIAPATAIWQKRDVGRLKAIYSELGFTRLAQALPVDADSQTDAGVAAETAGESVDNDPTPRGPTLDTTTLAGQEAFEFASDTGGHENLEGIDALVAWLDASAHLERLAISLRRIDDHATRSPWTALGLATSETRSAVVSVSGIDTVTGAEQRGVSTESLRSILRDVLARPALEVQTHGGKSLWLALLDGEISQARLAFDSELAGYLLDPDQQHDLPTLVQRYLGLQSALMPQTPARQRKAPSFTREQLLGDTARRAKFVYRLARIMIPRIADEGLEQLYTKIELPLCRVLARMQRTGVLIDTSQLSTMSTELDREISRLEAEAILAVGHPFNVNSPRQLETILFDELGLKPLRRTKTSRSTDAATLEVLADEHALPRLILAHRQVSKLKSTYVDTLPALVDSQTGRVHSSWEQAVTATGRLSSIDPNLQNIPIRTDLGRAIRKAFIAPPGVQLVSADYSQIELRVLAHLSGDPELLAAFQTGQDVHLRTAAAVFGVDPAAVTKEMRRQAKAVNFGVIYGQTESGLAGALGIPRHQASEFIAAYYRRYRGVREFMNATLEQARHGKAVRSLYGRRRYFNEIDSANRSLRLSAERMAMNMPIQATAADILKISMLKLDEPVTPNARMIMSVHDELVFEVPDDEVDLAMTRIAEEMQGAANLLVQLLVDVGHASNWADAH